MRGYQQDKEHLEVSKDTERVDELKSMVQAWEAEQPGRTKKVRNCLVERKAGQCE